MKENRDPIDVAFGTIIRTRRTAQRMSLEELGRQIGVTYQQIQKYETGANRVSVSMAARIAKAFGCTLSDLVASIEDAEPAQAPRVPSIVNLRLAGRVAGQFDEMPPHIRETLSALVEAIADKFSGGALPSRSA